MRSTSVGKLVGGIAVVTAFAAGCGPSSSSDDANAHDRAATPSAGTAQDGAVAPADADPETKKLYLLENAVAACMKKRGFEYRPHVAAPNTKAGGNATDGKDYELTKTFRQKYGFGIYSAAVYPDDAERVEGTGGMANDPNSAYVKALKPSQQAAYIKALTGSENPLGQSQGSSLGGCTGEANKEVYGSEADRKRQWEAQEERNRRSGQALNGDEQLIRLAQDYATCLRGKGLTVSNTQPTEIGDTVKFGISAAMPAEGVAQMDRKNAEKALSREIEAALADLECGKDFRSAYFPKLKAHPYSGGQG
ncbi:hypothetical protein [Streptomyces sp. AC627_RSS907]|uniref:hypothetical protein n=1 Tax=Streptomyces sp. AC627_RSS907 TaxID=2823684 RepID=UPI001C24F39A|nr:hypothetical protein [Streptomyces sp. AC627_RSS907]